MHWGNRTTAPIRTDAVNVEVEEAFRAILQVRCERSRWHASSGQLARLARTEYPTDPDG